MIEFVCVLGIFFLFVTVSALSTFSEIHREKKSANWAFRVNESSTLSSSNSVTEAYKYTPGIIDAPSDIELSDYTDIYHDTVSESIGTNLEISANLVVNSDFEHSEVTDDAMSSISSLISAVNEHLADGNNSYLSDSYIASISDLVGPNISKLITNSYNDLKENQEAVIIGLVNSDNTTLSFLDQSIPLTGAEEVVSGEEDLVLFKGMLLPTGEFRVLHHEDADTVEHGYGTEKFILKKVS